MTQPYDDMHTPPTADRPEPVRVKVLSKVSAEEWLRQLPDGSNRWGQCEFLFDSDAREYDWLVVYNDLPASNNERFSERRELLACARQNTLLITTEPSSIKTYGTTFTAQFGWVLTSQEAWALPHRGRIYSQPALHWFYGLGRDHKISFNTMLEAQLPNKKKTIATVCSSKKQRHTLHNRRYQFTQDLKQQLPELDIYGHGVRDMDDKAESLDDYCYHIAIENHIGMHHWTEKLADAFLGFTLPFYYGCPNAAEYFPAESFIPIDIHDLQQSHAIIAESIRNNEYEKRLPYIIQARQQVLQQYNLFAVLDREISQRHTTATVPGEPQWLLSRRALRKQHPATGLRDAFEKVRTRLIHRFRN